MKIFIIWKTFKFNARQEFWSRTDRCTNNEINQCKLQWIWRWEIHNNYPFSIFIHTMSNVKEICFSSSNRMQMTASVNNRIQLNWTVNDWICWNFSDHIMRCEMIRCCIYKHVMLLFVCKNDVFIVCRDVYQKALVIFDEVNHLIYGVCNVNRLRRHKFYYLF